MLGTGVYPLNLPATPPVRLTETSSHVLETDRAVTQPLGPLDQGRRGPGQTNRRPVGGEHGLEQVTTTLLWNEWRIEWKQRVMHDHVRCIQPSIVRQSNQMRRQVGDRGDFAVTEQHVQQSLVAADPQMYSASSNTTVEQLVRIEPGEIHISSLSAEAVDLGSGQPV
ncbi:hypothetical protein D9M69_482840 [compost metagenome]